MQITVLGASGRVGRLVVERLLAQGHSVIALVHSTNRFENTAGVTVVKGDARNREDIAKAIAGSGAIISALGSWGSDTKNILTRATEHVTSCAPKGTRFITVSGTGAFLPKEKANLWQRLGRWQLQIIAAGVLKDGDQHLALLSASELAWTCLRSPVMSGTSNTSYRLSKKLPGPFTTLPRAAVAAATVDQITDTNWIGKSPIIYPCK